MDCNKIISIIENRIKDLKEIKRTDPKFYAYLCEGANGEEPKDLIERYSEVINKLQRLG